MRTETISTHSSASVASGVRNLSSATSANANPAQASHFGRTPVPNASTEAAAINTARPTQAKL